MEWGSFALFGNQRQSLCKDFPPSLGAKGSLGVSDEKFDSKTFLELWKKVETA